MSVVEALDVLNGWSVPRNSPIQAAHGEFCVAAVLTAYPTVVGVHRSIRSVKYAQPRSVQTAATDVLVSAAKRCTSAVTTCPPRRESSGAHEYLPFLAQLPGLLARRR